MTAAGIASEQLAVGVDEAGARHAIYPTAQRTLCNLCGDLLELEAAIDGPGPNCEICEPVAREFDRIDHSAPRPWFRPDDRPPGFQPTPAPARPAIDLPEDDEELDAIAEALAGAAA